MPVLDALKGKNVTVKAREMPTTVGVLVDYDNLYIKIQSKTTTYYIPHFNVIYIQPAT
jgi:small nuclear ribonucleoprotein (snRNP)-like protein